MKQISRIELMEQKYDKTIKILQDLQNAMDAFDACKKDINDLIEYYESGLWQKDYISDEEGQLPKDLKRGVLSQDGLYDLLSDYDQLKELLEKKD